MARKNISDTTRQAVLLECGYMCGNPNCRHIITLELHHIEWVKEGGGNNPSNLLALCPNCHSLHTLGHIPREAIEIWKGMLLSLNNPNRSSADILIFIYKYHKNYPDSPLHFTADGLAMMAGLLNSGLLEITLRAIGGGYNLSRTPTFVVETTESGKQLVAAWLDGKRSRLNSVILGSAAAGGDGGLPTSVNQASDG